MYPNKFNHSMKILHVIDSEGLFGAEAMLVNLASEQRKLGLQPTILNMRMVDSSESSFESEAVSMGLDFRSFSIKTGLDLPGAFKIIRFAVTNGYVLIHSHGYKPNILLGLMPKRLRRLSIVITLHGWTSAGRFGKLLIYEWLDIKSLNNVDAVVAVSKATAAHSALRRIKPCIIHNGISTIDFESKNRLADRRLVKFSENGFTIGSIGRLSAEKGYRHLIEALRLVIQRGIDANLIIIGEGNERSFLEQLIEKLKLTDRVLLPGYCTTARDYLPCLDVFVLSSLTEGLPITLLETMQANVPIVATRVGGIPEVLENGKDGLLVEPRDPEKLADAISRIYHDSELRDKLMSCAYKKVITDYTAEKMALQYLEVYRLLYENK